MCNRASPLAWIGGRCGGLQREQPTTDAGRSVAHAAVHGARVDAAAAIRSGHGRRRRGHGHGGGHGRAVGRRRLEQQRDGCAGGRRAQAELEQSTIKRHISSPLGPLLDHVFTMHCIARQYCTVYNKFIYCRLIMYEFVSLSRARSLAPLSLSPLLFSFVDRAHPTASHSSAAHALYIFNYFDSVLVYCN